MGTDSPCPGTNLCFRQNVCSLEISSLPLCTFQLLYKISWQIYSKFVLPLEECIMLHWIPGTFCWLKLILSLSEKQLFTFLYALVWSQYQSCKIKLRISWHRETVDAIVLHIRQRQWSDCHSDLASLLAVAGFKGLNQTSASAERTSSFSANAIPPSESDLFELLKAWY